MARESLCPRVPAQACSVLQTLEERLGGSCWVFDTGTAPAYRSSGCVCVSDTHPHLYGLLPTSSHFPQPFFFNPDRPTSFFPSLCQHRFLHDWHSERSGCIEQAFSPMGAQETRLWVCPFPPPSERIATSGRQRPGPGLGPPHREASDSSLPSGDQHPSWASFPAYRPAPDLPAPPPEGAEEPTGGAQETRGKMACEVLLSQGCGPWQSLHDGSADPRAPNPEPRSPQLAVCVSSEGEGFGSLLHLEHQALPGIPSWTSGSGGCGDTGWEAFAPQRV